jgi:Fe-S oxidoreductase
VLAQLRASGDGSLDRVNLASLLCGSEGTLAVTLEAELALAAAPAARGLGIVAFADVDAALRALPPILATGPSAVELVDDVVLGLAAGNAECRRYLARLPDPARDGRGAVLYVEHFGDDDAAVRSRLDALADSFGTPRVQVHLDPVPMADAWALRKAGEPLLHGMAGPRKPITFIEDLAVDPAVLADFVADFREIVERHGTSAAYFAHASVGCLHMRPLIDLDDEADRRTMQAIASEATDLVMRYGGALSGEHGDGRLRSGLLERFYGAELVAAMRRIKAIFDPGNLLNPGNIVAPEPMTAHLRVEPHERPVAVPPVETYFRYEREHGFAGAVTMCNGAGVCRRRSGGTMCPSYRATRDERHATRGRGNALRLAITGQLPDDGAAPAWNDPATLQTLDLCLSCKACKAECPSNVDLARLKAEYLAQSYRAAGGAPLRARLLGHVHRLNRLGAAVAPLANGLARWDPARRLADCLIGLDPRRSLPAFERSLHRWFREREPLRAREGGPAVVLLADCFTAFNEPAIGRDAVAVLEAFGYRVLLPDAGCCGRALISMGLLEEAVGVCSRTAARLAEIAERERPVAIVGTEPSCVSALADDWPELRLRADASVVRRLADLAVPIEQFLEQSWEHHPRRPALSRREDGPPVLLHGHCHQKALWGVDAGAALVARLAGRRLLVPDSGCCGMAGAFGYGAEHYDLSMRIGELALFPAIRDAGPDAVLLASGTSCRHQIRDGAGRRARHPVELLASALGEEG